MSLLKTAAAEEAQYQQSPSNEFLAERALSLVATRKGHGHDSPQAPAQTLLHAPWSIRMAEAAVADDSASLTALAHEMRVASVPIEAIIDVVIPEAARELGRCWAEDRIGFSSTSIGTARLQGLLRDLMRTGTAPLIAGLSEPQPAILIVVPDGEQHTLGALIASAQLSRAGFDTVLSLCESVARLKMRLKAEQFAAVCLSISRVETLESVGSLTNIIRWGCNYPVKIMVGGAAVDDAKDYGIGADAVTNDLPEALSRCGLKISMRVAARDAMRA